jgi:hypothetical protein
MGAAQDFLLAIVPGGEDPLVADDQQAVVNSVRIRWAYLSEGLPITQVAPEPLFPAPSVRRARLLRVATVLGCWVPSAITQAHRTSRQVDMGHRNGLTESWDRTRRSCCPRAEAGTTRPYDGVTRSPGAAGP